MESKGIISRTENSQPTGKSSLREEKKNIPNEVLQESVNEGPEPKPLRSTSELMSNGGSMQTAETGMATRETNGKSTICGEKSKSVADPSKCIEEVENGSESKNDLSSEALNENKENKTWTNKEDMKEEREDSKENLDENNANGTHEDSSKGDMMTPVEDDEQRARRQREYLRRASTLSEPLPDVLEDTDDEDWEWEDGTKEVVAGTVFVKAR